MGSVLEERRRSSAERLTALDPYLNSARDIANGKACVYLTGSFARGEASEHSDLDLFMAGKTHPADKGRAKRVLNLLDETCLKAELIRATRSLKFPEFSGDGEYLVQHTVHELISSLGKRDDDSLNTFTARLLLLLESKALLGSEIYEEAILQTLQSYWRDFQGREDKFIPAFLCNDILRLWRTFCVNYEANTASTPSDKKAKRRLKKYKLAHSRLLTCYSAILFLLDRFNDKQTVTLDDAVEMVRLTPTMRVEKLKAKHSATPVQGALRNLLEGYEAFLSLTDASESELVSRILNDPTVKPKMMEHETQFGLHMFEALREMGKDSKLYHMLLV